MRTTFERSIMIMKAFHIHDIQQILVAETEIGSLLDTMPYHDMTGIYAVLKLPG